MLPSLLVGLPSETSVATIVGTNKTAQVVGNLTAGVGYLRKQRPDWRMFLWAAGLAGLGAVVGARIVTYMSRAVYTPILLVVLVIIGIYTWRRPSLGGRPQWRRWQTSRLSSDHRAVPWMLRRSHWAGGRDLLGAYVRCRRWVFLPQGLGNGEDLQHGDKSCHHHHPGDSRSCVVACRLATGDCECSRGIDRCSNSYETRQRLRADDVPHRYQCSGGADARPTHLGSLKGLVVFPAVFKKGQPQVAYTQPGQVVTPVPKWARTWA